MPTYMKGAGMSENPRAKSIHEDGSVTFGAEIAVARQYIPLKVTGPKLTVEQAVSLIKDRMDEFGSHDGGRESPKLSVVRKYIAAHGDEFVKQVKAQGDHMFQMEVDMMFGDGHAGIAYLPALDNPLSVTVSSDGIVRGFSGYNIYPA